MIFIIGVRHVVDWAQEQMGNIWLAGWLQKRRVEKLAKIDLMMQQFLEEPAISVFFFLLFED